MYKIRAAQIDLNRQKETFDFFKLYVDFLVDSGYNTLMFYIAWRLRLPSHPFPSPEEAYDAEQIRSMVDYARSQGLDVIPTTNLTYVTSLLKYEGTKNTSSRAAASGGINAVIFVTQTRKYTISSRGILASWLNWCPRNICI